MNDDWLKHIRDTMSDFETDEPENLWEAIEAGLPQSRRARKTIFRPWMRRAAAAALCALAAIPVYIAMRNGNDFTAEPLRFNKLYTDQSGLLAMPEIKPVEKSSQIREKIAIAIAEKPQTVITETTEPENKASKSSDSAKVKEPEIPAPTDSDTKNRHNSNYYRHTYNDLALQKRKLSSGRLSISLGASSGAGSLLAMNSGPRQPYMYSSPEGITWYDSPTLGMLVSTKGRKSETDYKHKQPVKTGISFMYAINDRLSIGSGLTYSYLASDIKETIGSSSWNGSQKLHYIGIPVNIRYRIASLNRFDLYAIGGASVEKCISARVNMQDYPVGMTNNQTSGKQLPKPFQFSANAAAGIQYNISGNFGIYAEPGLSYYFDDNSKLKTFYKDKPLNFSFDFGLRFTFE